MSILSIGTDYFRERSFESKLMLFSVSSGGPLLSDSPHSVHVLSIACLSAGDSRLYISTVVCLPFLKMEALLSPKRL